MRRTIVVTALSAAVFAIPPAIASADFTVNNTADTVSAVPADASCDADLVTGGLQCTLREAIKEGNATPGSDTITFDATVFNGVAANSTISVGSLISVSQPTTLAGGDCDPSASAARPCVGIETTFNGGALGLVPGNSSIRGIAFSKNSAFGVVLLGSFGATGQTGSITNSWFGIRLDQTVTGCGSGYGIELQGNAAITVGGTSASDRNVIAGCSNGMMIRWQNNTIQGNYFGTMPDGVTVSPATSNAYDIILTGYTGPGNGANDNLIGGADPGTPGTCDGPCNVFANTGSSSIRIGAGTLQADNNQVKGNYFGLAADGDTVIPGGSTLGIEHAADTTIGGPSAADRNYFANGGLQSGSDATGTTTIQNNYFSVLPSGDETIAGGNGASVYGAGDAVKFLGNRLAGMLTLYGSGVEAYGNSIGIGPGGENLGYANEGMYVNGSGHQIGGASPGQGNEIGNVVDGIVVQGPGGSNVIEGNAIGVDSSGAPQPLTSAGIFMNGSPDNRIGGDTVGSQNKIVSAAGSGIVIVNSGSNHNTVARNTGSAFSGLFLDLGNDGPGNPQHINDDMQAPTVDLVSPGSIDGSDMLSGKVRVFKTKTTTGDIASFLTEKTLAAETFSVPFVPQITIGQCISASITNAAGSTSEFTTAQAAGGGACDTTPPTGSINSGPNGVTNDATPTFGFTSNEIGSTFECRVDAQPFAPCSSPHTTAALTEGPHSFDARPIDGPGNAGLPATRLFSVDLTAPSTGKISGPRKTHSKRPKFKFPASAGASGFRCTLDKRKPVSCQSPFKTPKLKKGKHVLKVAARDAAGNVDATPSVFRFKYLVSSVRD